MCKEFMGLNIVLHAEVLDTLLLMLQPPGSNTTPIQTSQYLIPHSCIYNSVTGHATMLSYAGTGCMQLGMKQHRDGATLEFESSTQIADSIIMLAWHKQQIVIY